MWDIKYVHPFGLPTKRNLLLFITTLLVALFSYLLIAATPVQAAPNDDVKWGQGGLIYEGNKYGGPTENKADYKLPDGSVLYVFTEKTGAFQDEKLHVLYFPANAPPASQTSVQYTVYGMNSTGKLTDGSAPKTLSLDVATSAEEGEPLNPNSSSCKIDGIGWIVCSTTNFLATGMDWVFNVIAGFVAVRPLSVANDSVMHRVWEIMRNFANVAFVIAFLFVIYSQLTSVGLSNYGIKKILPRVIIAAILVNVSYWICVIAIDVSNILGYSLQGVFISFRELVTEGGNNSWQLTSWESVTSFILAGGAAAGMTIVGITSASAAMGAFSVAGVALLLVPILMGAFITVMVVLFILAARQAIITLLVIISPLALVAYLLPNTEKWFEKWRGLFMTMLIFFPAFSLVFGGAQFAGLLIIQNADDINTVLLGMAVQIAPLAITPLLLKLSGTLLSRVAGIINDPSKGIKDRTKNWSKDRLAARAANENAKTREMAKNGTLRGRHFVRRSAMGTDTRRRLREGQKAANETRATSLFNDSSAGRALNTAERAAEREKQTIQQTLDKEWSVKAKVDIKSLDKELELRVTADEAGKAKEELESIFTEAKAGSRGHFEQISGHNLPYNGPQQSIEAANRVDLLNRAQDTASHLALEGMRKSEAERKQRSSVSDMLYKNREMYQGKSVLDYAAGIGSSEIVQATTIATVRKEYVEHVSAQDQLMQHLKLDAAEFQKAASGLHGDVVIDDERGKHTFKVDNEYVREAAIAHQGVAGSFKEKLELLEQSWGEKDAAGNITAKGTTYDFRDSIQDMVKKGMINAAPFANDKSLNAILKGEYKGRESTIHHSIRQIYEGRVKSEAISTANKVAMEIMYDVTDVTQNPTALRDFYDSMDPATRPSLSKFQADFDENYAEMRKQASDVLDNPILRKNINKELLDVLTKNALPR